MLQPPRDEVEAETPALAADDKVPGIPGMSGRIKVLKFALNFDHLGHLAQ